MQKLKDSIISFLHYVPAFPTYSFLLSFPTNVLLSYPRYPGLLPDALSSFRMSSEQIIRELASHPHKPQPLHALPALCEALRELLGNAVCVGCTA